MNKNFWPIILVTFSICFLAQTEVLAQTNSEEIKGYDKASYNSSMEGKFMKSWLVAGPFAVGNNGAFPNDSIQEKAFNTDLITGIKVITGKPLPAIPYNQQKIKWQIISYDDDDVKLDSFYKGKDFVYAYALAEIKTNAAANKMLAIGSDDGIKVWLNGKVIHTNSAARAVKKDEDLIPLNLVKGSNQLLLKVQNITGGWGFIARILDGTELTNQLITAIANGTIYKIKLFLDGGADINAANEGGIVPIMAAKISGRPEVIQMLLNKGAADKPVPAAETIIDNYYKVLNNKETPGIALLVAKDGTVLYKKGFGYADIKNKRFITPDTKFRIGSVTKQFIAAAILKLQENNLISVQDKLSKFIPDFPRGDEVTIHHLLTHTSGIHSYTSKDNFIQKVITPVSPDSLINTIKKDPFDFNPGDRFLYNNSGYFLLGYIIGKVTGKPFATYLKETFFEPLAMKNTGVYYTGIQLENEAKGYAKKGNQFDDALNWDMSWAGGAGALYSTVDDLLKWNQGLYGGKVLNEKSMAAALTPVILKNGQAPPMRYGYGLGLNKYRGTDIIGHAGGLHGFLTQLVYYPTEKITVVMFSNTMGPEVNFDPNKIAEAFLWNKLDKQVGYIEATEKPKSLTAYTGRYDLLNIGILTITAVDDKLFAQLSGQQKFEIFPLSADEFFWKVVDAKIKFIRDEKDEINQAVLFQNALELKATKLK